MKPTMFRMVQAACFLGVLSTPVCRGSNGPPKNQDKVPAAEFYVSPGGNDRWSGRLPAPNEAGTDGPFATIARAQAALRGAEGKNGPGVVLIRGGRYQLDSPLVFKPEDLGTARRPIRFAAFPGEKPVLSGGVRLKGWKVGADGTWSTPLPGDRRWTFRHVSVNDAFRHRPRVPGKGFHVIAGLAGADPRGKYNTPADRFEFAAGDIRGDWKHLREIEAVVLHFWVDTHLPIASVDQEKRVVVFDRFSRRRFTDDYRKAFARYYLTNVFEALSPGTFYCDMASGLVHYRPMPGEDPVKTQVVVPKLTGLIQFEGDPRKKRFVEHIELDGLVLQDTTWNSPAKEAVDAQAASVVPGAVRLRGARNCVLKNCELRNLGGYGIELAEGCRSVHLVGNELHHLGAGGIRQNGGGVGSAEDLRTGHNAITDNHLHHLGELFHSGVGILSQHSGNNAIAHNHIHHLYYTGISVGWVWGYGPSVSAGNRIEFNRIHDVGQKLLSDMGGIYLLGRQPGTVVRGNVVHDVDSWNYGGWGIYTDEGSSGIVIENNLVYRTKSGGFHQHYGKDNIVRNNIFALAREEQVARSRMEPHRSFTFERNIVWFREGPLLGKNWKDDRFAMDRNLYWNAAGETITFPGGDLAQWRRRGHDVHSVIADPRFRAPDRGDFTLAEDSPARKIGFVPFDPSRAGPRK